MKLLVGFGSKARHGKDGCAAAIIDYLDAKRTLARVHGYGTQVPPVKRHSFAAALKTEVANAITAAGGVERLLLSGFYDEFTYMSHKFPEWVTADAEPDMSDPLLPMGKHSKMLQWWGTEFRREQCGANYWVREVHGQLIQGINLITDVRFPNEAEFVKDMGGYTVNVTRLNKDGSIYADPSRPADHASEIALDGYNWDFRIIVKDGDQALKADYACTLIDYLMGRAQ